jgi:hypothetical protein
MYILLLRRTESKCASAGDSCFYDKWCREFSSFKHTGFINMVITLILCSLYTSKMTSKFIVSKT